MKKLILIHILGAIMAFSLTLDSWAGKYDFVSQREIYTYSDYSISKTHGALILMDTIDRRPDKEHKGGLVDDQTLDSDYTRTPDHMVQEIFTREMQRCGMIMLYQPTPETADYKMHIEILSFYGGTKERESNNSVKDWFVPRNAVGFVTLRVILKDKAGKELINVDYSTTSELEMARMSNYHKGAVKAAGMALREAVNQILTDVDHRIQSHR